MLNNVIELIDFILDEKNMKIFYSDFPLDGEGMLIECSNITPFEDIDGLNELYSSHVKFFVRLPKQVMGYVEIEKKLNSFYKQVYNTQGTQVENWFIERVEPYERSAFSIEKGTVYIVSLDFNILYRKGSL
jgi:hypothetical protein